MIVLISGKMGSGKTTLANALSDYWTATKGQRAVLINFADPLYNMHDYIRGYCRTYGIERPDKDRDLLQLLGTEWGRNCVSPNIWVDLLKAKIKEMQDPSRALNQKFLFIVGDCRFPNELEAMPGALKIRLNCSAQVRKERCTKWTDTAHASESALDGMENDFDLVFDTEETSVQECVEEIVPFLEGASRGV